MQRIDEAINNKSAYRVLSSLGSLADGFLIPEATSPQTLRSGPSSARAA